MRHRTRRKPGGWLLVGAALSTFVAPLAAQSTGALFGYVVDDRDGSPVAGAEVSVLGTDTRTVADSTGSFLLPELPAGLVRLRIGGAGYTVSVEQIEIAPESLDALEVRLLPVAIMLNELVVTAKLRSQTWGGSVAEVRPDRGANLTAADLVARVPNLNISPEHGALGKSGVVSLRGVGTLQGSRAPAIYLDGIRISEVTTPVSGAGFPALTVLAQIPAREVTRIQVLRGASAAARYGDAANGVIVIETNRGGGH